MFRLNKLPINYYILNSRKPKRKKRKKTTRVLFARGETGVADCLSLYVLCCVILYMDLRLCMVVWECAIYSIHTRRVLFVFVKQVCFAPLKLTTLCTTLNYSIVRLPLVGCFCVCFLLFYWCFKLLGKFVSVATLNICWMRFQIGFSGDMGRGYLQLGITFWSGEFRFVGYVLGDRLWCSCSHLRGINPSFLYSYSRNEFVSFINGTGFVLFLLLLS